MTYVQHDSPPLEEVEAENERLREAIAEALTSLATGSAKDGYAFSILDAALAARTEEPATPPNPDPNLVKWGP